MTAPSETIDLRRRRLLWRASHRGIKEMDLILGGFVAREIFNLDEQDLDQLEIIVALPDHDLLSWATRQQEVPIEHRSLLLTAILGSTR